MDIEHTKQQSIYVEMTPQLKTVQEPCTISAEFMAILQQDTEKLLHQERSQIPDQNSDRHPQKELVAHWEIENGKLVCKWLVNDVQPYKAVGE
ncbi:MAG: hypothetical protein HC866_17660 [Leptolyngbyaceae cyanobacterium RU_5_1]|nr:hypothetical protein [Leptolyngbyaceae cyanobacterium RU_5_1]